MSEKPVNSLEGLFENRPLLNAMVHAIAEECEIGYPAAYEKLREGAMHSGGRGTVRRALEAVGVSPAMIGARMMLLEQEAAEDARRLEASAKPKKKARKQAKQARRELAAAEADMAAGVWPGSRDLNGAIVKYLDDHGLGREKYTEIAHQVLTGTLNLTDPPPDEGTSAEDVIQAGRRLLDNSSNIHGPLVPIDWNRS